MNISTERFKTAVAKAEKGASNNKLLPITQMIGIKSFGDKVILCTTDKSNSVEVTIDKLSGDEFDVTVEVSLFSKLISKITSDTVELKVDNGNLCINGDGTYKLPIISDEDGEIHFPKIKRVECTEEILLSSVLSVRNINSPALSSNMNENVFLTGYYVDSDKVVSTDTDVVCFNKINLFNGRKLLVSPQTMTLLTLASHEKFTANFEATDRAMFNLGDVYVQSLYMSGIDEYPIEEINQYLDMSYASMCKIPKALLSSALDRLSLFVEPYDHNGAYFKFTRFGVNITSKKLSSCEVINFVESKNFAPFICCVDVPMLKSIVDSIPADIIELYYGDPNAIQFVVGNVTQVVSLMADEDIEESVE